MKSFLLKFLSLSFIALLSFKAGDTQKFQGKAYYFSKSKMQLGSWGAKLSEAQKKDVAARLKNRLQKTYVLSFDKVASVFKEEDKLDAISGATDTWGANFTRGVQYKNVKDVTLVQAQEFYGKKFLVKDKLHKIDWKMGKETKQIGQYTCFKATASISQDDLAWYNFSWSDLRRKDEDGDGKPDVPMVEVEAWYSLQVPVSHGPAEFWGLPGLILEVSAGDTTILCSKIVINPKEEIKIEAPKSGKEITKDKYQETIKGKMQEMMSNRGRRRG
ncbi:GLPGLI family protein [Kordia sp.]|uniref:GLPGLI family protein n=1 Tax=Kordia sp. TaxID=1965332 RepID=UPI003D6C1EDC